MKDPSRAAAGSTKYILGINVDQDTFPALMASASSAATMADAPVVHASMATVRLPREIFRSRWYPVAKAMEKGTSPHGIMRIRACPTELPAFPGSRKLSANMIRMLMTAVMPPDIR